MARVNQDLYEQVKGMMSPEQIQEYKEMGEKMYNSIDFNTSQILEGQNDPLFESIAYISEAIKSGMHPSFLDDDERKVLEEGYGKEWYTKFGYESLDI